MSDVYSGDLNQLLIDEAVVAVSVSQPLRPVEGDGTPFFPPTFLGVDKAPTYCISDLGDGRNVCIVDSVQSQANRIEEAFMAGPYRSLVRRVEVSAKLPKGETKTLDMLQLGHRLADAAVTFSTLAEEAHQAMRSFAQGPDVIARLSPMSLLCGVWDSRPDRTQLKIPRALSASILARDVRPLRRMATFTGSFWSKDLGLEGTRSSEGLDPVPAAESLGGVIAEGSIQRSATLNMIALRQNCKIGSAGASDAARYIYGLGLVSLTLMPEAFLRQGCLLVYAGEAALRVVLRSGQELPLALNHDQALAFATDASKTFGIADLPPIQAEFQTEKVEKPKAGKEKAAKAK